MKGGLIGLLIITPVYLLALFLGETKANYFQLLPQVFSAFPFFAAAALLSFLFRYLRWRWLLKRQGHVFRFGDGLAAYIAGFTYTATPGKIGELARIRYCAPLRVPAKSVLSAFIFERTTDVVVVSAFAIMLVAEWYQAVWLVALFAAVVTGLYFAVSRSMHVSSALAYFSETKYARVARVISQLNHIIMDLRSWTNAKDISISLLCGFLSWSILSVSFVILSYTLADPSVGFRQLFALYPFSMLAGAVSMLPGGLGATEAVLVLTLRSWDVDLDVAVLVAVTIRFSNLWFAIVCGLLCILYLEITRNVSEPFKASS